MRRLLLGTVAVLALAHAAQAQGPSGGCATGQPCQNLASLSVSPSTTTKYIGPGGDYPNLTTALAVVNEQVLPFGTNWNLVLLDGQITEPGAVLYSVEGGNNVTISGQHVYNFTLSSIQGSSGAQGSWSYVLNLDSVANIAVGDYLTIPAPSGGTNPSYIAGVWPVTAVDGVNNRVTLATTSHSPTAASGAVTGTVTDMKSTVKFVNSDGFDIWGGGVTANLSNFNVVGDGTANHTGLSLQDGDRVYASGTLSVSGFGSVNVLSLYGSELNVDRALVSSSSGGQGVYANDGGIVNAPTLVTSGNTSHGALADNGGIVDAATFVSSGNGADGLRDIQGGISFVSTAGQFNGNAGNGVTASSAGAFAGTTTATLNNTGSGVNSGNLGFVSAGIVTSSGNGSADMLALNSSNGYATTGQLAVGYSAPQGHALVVGGDGVAQIYGTTFMLKNTGAGYTGVFIAGGSTTGLQVQDGSGTPKWEVGHRGASNSYDFQIYSDMLSARAFNISAADNHAVFGGTVTPGSVAVGATNACSNAGATAWATDATVAYASSTRGGQITGGGGNAVPAYCDGTHWDFQ